MLPIFFDTIITILLMVILILIVVILYHSKRHIGHTPFYVFAGILTLFFQLFSPHFLINFYIFSISPLWVTVLPAIFSMLLLVQQNEGKRAADSLVLGLIISYVFSVFFMMILGTFTTPKSQYLLWLTTQYSPFAVGHLLFNTAVFAVGVSSVLILYRFLHHRMWGRAASIIISLWSSLIFTFFISAFEMFFPVVADLVSVESYLFGMTVAALVFGVVLFGYYYFFGWEPDGAGHS